MLINTKAYLEKYIAENIIDNVSLDFELPDYDIDTQKIKAVIIHEDPTNTDDDYFTVPYFRKSGFEVNSIGDVIDSGVYMTSALKIEKVGKEAEPGVLSLYMPVLLHELLLFENLKVIILAGHTSIKAINYIAKWKTGKNLIPSATLSKIRQKDYQYNGIKVIPSYKMIVNFVPGGDRSETICGDIMKMRRFIESV